MLNCSLKERRCEYQPLLDLIDKPTFYRDIRPEAVFFDRKRARRREQQPDARFGELSDRFAYQQVVLGRSTEPCALSPAGTFRHILGAPSSRVGRQDEFCLGPAGTTRFSDTVRPGGLHRARV
jgi:hypothetical protein